MEPPAPPTATPLLNNSDPELPDDVAPELRVRDPLTPLAGAEAVDTTTPPVDDALLPPLVINTLPPVLVPDVDEPPEMDTAPPATLAAVDEPADSTTAPP